MKEFPRSAGQECEAYWISRWRTGLCALAPRREYRAVSFGDTSRAPFSV